MRIGDVELSDVEGATLKAQLASSDWDVGMGAYLKCVHRKLRDQLEKPDTDDKESALIRGEIRRIKILRRLRETAN